MSTGGTATDELSVEPADASSASGPIYVIRLAAAALVLPPHLSVEDHKSVDQAIRASLSNDPRVIGLDDPTDWTVKNVKILDLYERSLGEVHFDSVDLGEEDLWGGPQSVSVLRLNHFIRFTVRVPPKNQPLYRNVADIPTDTYEVIWDGVSLAVLWSQPDPKASFSGGHIAIDVLTDVVKEAGYRLSVPGCTPNCEHRFFHCDVVAFPSDPPDTYVNKGRVGAGRSVRPPFNSAISQADALHRIHHDLGYAIEWYMLARGLVDALYEVEDIAFVNMANLLSLNYARSLRPKRIGRRIKHQFSMRGSQARSRALISGLWLTLAVHNRLVDSLKSINAQLMQSVSAPGLAEVIDLDTLHADAALEVDLSLIRTAIEESANRVDTRFLIIATASSALSALAGAGLVTALGG